MRTTPSQATPLVVLAAIGCICAIAYLDYSLGFGFNLFPLFLLPLAYIAWTRSLTATMLVALLAAILIVLKVFLTKEYYPHHVYWYWDSLVKCSLLFMLSYGLWRIRQLSRQQQEQNAARINQLNRSLRQQVDQLTAANRELAEVSYTISHDLRAPLRHIGGFVELLKSRNSGELDPQARHYLEVIAQSTQTMGNLVDDLLAFAQLGRTEMTRRAVDLNALLRDALSELTPLQQGRQVVWQIAELPTVTGDSAMLRLVLYNLAHNALKFTRPRSPARIEIGCRELPEEYQIHVRDNGVGFDMQYVAKVFGRFQRLHTAEEFEGTGMGLANVQRIISRHGGRIWAEGAVDRGATVWFSLPKSAPGDSIPAQPEQVAGTATDQGGGPELPADQGPDT
jgi:signal transduction histidine kinase